MAKSVFGKMVKAALGVAGVAAAAAAAGVAYGLNKWAKDEDSRDLKVTTGGVNGLHIHKTDDGKFVVDTKYEWTDADFEDDGEENGEIVIDLSKKAVEETVEELKEEACCCGEKVKEKVEEVVEKVTCGCEEEAAPEEEAKPEEGDCGCGCDE